MTALDDDKGGHGGLPNLISLIDLFLFILLAAVAGQSSAAQHSLSETLRLPPEPGHRSDVVPHELLVEITAGGEFKINGHVTAIDAVRSRIKKLRSGTTVVIQADEAAKHGNVAAVVSAAAEASLQCVFLVKGEHHP